MNYYEKYIKYKNKYINIKNMIGGSKVEDPNTIQFNGKIDILYKLYNEAVVDRFYKSTDNEATTPQEKEKKEKEKIDRKITLSEHDEVIIQIKKLFLQYLEHVNKKWKIGTQIVNFRNDILKKIYNKLDPKSRNICDEIKNDINMTTILSDYDKLIKEYEKIDADRGKINESINNYLKLFLEYPKIKGLTKFDSTYYKPKIINEITQINEFLKNIYNDAFNKMGNTNDKSSKHSMFLDLMNQRIIDTIINQIERINIIVDTKNKKKSFITSSYNCLSDDSDLQKKRNEISKTIEDYFKRAKEIHPLIDNLHVS